MAAITDLWRSERGLLAVALVIAATVLAALAVITSEQWLDYTKWIFGFYVTGKSLTSAVETFSARGTTQATPPAGGAS